MLFELIDIRKGFSLHFLRFDRCKQTNKKKSREKFFNPFIKLSDILMHYDKVDLARTHLSQKKRQTNNKKYLFFLLSPTHEYSFRKLKTTRPYKFLPRLKERKMFKEKEKE